MREKEQLLRDIGMADFVLIELTLFLDTHPNDHRAMEYFDHYNRIKNQMEEEFSRKYFPLNLRLTDCGKEWRWGEAPLPWEGECA